MLSDVVPETPRLVPSMLLKRHVSPLGVWISSMNVSENSGTKWRKEFCGQG